MEGEASFEGEEGKEITEQESEQELDNAIRKNWYECEKREKELQSRLPAGGAVRAKVLSVEDVLYFEVGVAQTISVPSLFPLYRNP